jgi:hypothetical protein
MQVSPDACYALSRGPGMHILAIWQGVFLTSDELTEAIYVCLCTRSKTKE